MSLSLDAEYLKSLEPYMAVLANRPKFEIGDTDSRRAGGDGLCMRDMFSELRRSR